MLRAYPLILICLFLFLGNSAVATDTYPAPQTRPFSAPSQQDLEAIFTMAEQGDAGSQNYLGFLHATGQNVAKDEKVAFSWFQKAADQGYPEALGNLAMMYEKGLGVAKDLRTALSLHSQAAMAGYPVSMKRLASLYEAGFAGGERDPVKAEMWKTRYKETLKGGTSATGDTDTRQAEEKAPATAQAEKPAAPKLAAPPAYTQPPSIAGDAQTKPASSSRAGAATKPYFFQVDGKTTARQTMEVIQRIVDKRLLPPSKKFELVNPDGKNYRINIGPFADANQAASYKAKVMALLDDAPPVEPEQRTASAAENTAPPTEQAAPSKTPGATPPQVAPTAAQPLPATASSDEKSATPAPIVAAPAKLVVSSSTAESRNKEKQHYVEINGKATAREATELIQKIVETGMLPKNMRIELVNPDVDNYRIRIGPFADANDAAPQIAKINASIKATLTPPSMQRFANQELIPVAPYRKQAAPVPPPPPPKQEMAQPKIAPVAAPRTTSASVGGVPSNLAEPPPPAAKAVRGHYYFILLNAKNTFEDSVFLAQFLFMKELVPETHRVKIDYLDGQNFRVSVGPYSDLREANQQLKKISQQTSLKASIITLEKHAPASGDAVYQPFIQVNAQGNLDNAMTLTQTLMEKELLEPKMFAEVVNFGAGNYRVRYGPFKGAKEAGQNIQNLKKHLKASPILVNLERLVQVEGK